MPDVEVDLEGLVVGDDWDITQSIEGIPEGAPLSQAWFTVKESRDDDDSAAVIGPIEITAVANQNAGQIADTGDADPFIAVCVFLVLKEETADLTPGKRYHYDIQGRLTNGLVKTVQLGRLTPVAGVTSVDA